MLGSLVFLLALVLLIFSVYETRRKRPNISLYGAVLFESVLYFVLVPLPIMWISYVLAPVMSTKPLTYVTSLLVSSVLLGLYFGFPALEYYLSKKNTTKQ